MRRALAKVVWWCRGVVYRFEYKLDRLHLWRWKKGKERDLLLIAFGKGLGCCGWTMRVLDKLHQRIKPKAWCRCNQDGGNGLVVVWTCYPVRDDGASTTDPVQRLTE